MSDEPIGDVLAEIVEKARRKSPDRTRPQVHEGKTTGKLGDDFRKLRSDEKEQAKAKVIGYLRTGMTLGEAMDATGRTKKTFWAWARESTKFRQQCEAAQASWARSQAKDDLSWRERQDAFVPILRKDFKSWTEYQVAFRKQYFGFDTFDHQWRMLEAMEAAPAGGLTLILTPPEFMKTTLICDVVIGDLCDNPNLRVALISEDQDFSSRTIGRIESRLDPEGQMTALMEHFGPFKPEGRSNKKWNTEQFTTLASNHDEQDPTCISVGIRGRIRGSRWDRIYLDDIQSLRTKGNTKMILEIIQGDVITRPGKLGKIMFFGNRVGRGDIYEELERRNMLDEIVCIPALDTLKPKGSQSNFPRQWRDAQGRPTPDKAKGIEPIQDPSTGDQLGWDDDDLAQRRAKMDEDQWSRIYMMQPQSDFSSMVNPQDIANATDIRRVGEPAGVATMAGLDPSLQAHAFFGVSGYDAEHLYVMDVVDLFKPTTNQRLFAEIRRLNVRYHPGTWVIENNHVQSGYLLDDAFLEQQHEFGFRSVGHHTGSDKRDAILGVPDMMSAIVRGEIRFPTIQGENVSFARLFDQLISWRPDVATRRLVQDGVMCLWFQYLLWKKLRALIAAEANPIRRVGLDSITLYSGARTNIASLADSSRAKTPMTYEQQWDALTGKVTA